MADNFMNKHGTGVADAGYSIVPIAAHKKFPAEYSDGRWWPMKNWQMHAHTRTPELLIENVRDETGWIQYFSLEPHVLGYDEDGDEIASCTVSDLGPPKDDDKASGRQKSLKGREALLNALDEVSPRADGEGWVTQEETRVIFAASAGGSNQSDDAARKMYERAVADAEKAGDIEVMGTRGEKKLRKKPRTLDKDPP